MDVDEDFDYNLVKNTNNTKFIYIVGYTNRIPLAMMSYAGYFSMAIRGLSSLQAQKFPSHIYSGPEVMKLFHAQFNCA